MKNPTFKINVEFIDDADKPNLNKPAYNVLEYQRDQWRFIAITVSIFWAITIIAVIIL